VDDVSWEAEIAGASAAKFARKEEMQKEKKIVKPGRNIRYIVPQTISAQHDVTLYARVKDMEENVTLKVGDILSKFLRVVKPGEMLKIDLSHSQLRQLKGDAVELSVEGAKRRQNG
jgi:hypothetical protein